MIKYFLLIIFSTSVFAQIVDFNDVLNLTLKNDKNLQKQKLNTKISKLDIENINAISYGKINLSEEISRTNHSGYVFNSKLSSREASFNDFGFSENNGDFNKEPKNLNYPDSRNNFTTKLTYDLPLFTGFKLSKQKEILKLKQNAEILKLTLNKKYLSYEVLKAYNQAVIAKEFINASKKAQDSINFVLKSAIAFHKEGLVTKIDVNQAKLHKLNINAQVIEARNNYELALEYLRFLSSNDKISNVKELKTIHYDITNFTTLLNEALKNRDELKLQKINKSAMKKNIDIAKSSYYPSVYSHLEYGFNDDKLTFEDDKDYYTAMIGINYSLFDNTKSIKKQQTKITYKQSILDYEKTKDFIKLELQKDLLNVKTKEAILKEKVQAKILAKEIVEQSKLMYKNRLISMSELLKQEANFQNSKVQVLIAKYENTLALAKITLDLGLNLKGKND